MNATVDPQSSKRVEATIEVIRHPDPMKFPEDESLIKAVEKGNVDAMNKAFARGANVNAARENGQTPLMIASQMGNATMVQALIGGGATLNIETKKSGLTALKLAARNGHIDVADVLLGGGLISTTKGSIIKAMLLPGLLLCPMPQPRGSLQWSLISFPVGQIPISKFL